MRVHISITNNVTYVSYRLANQLKHSIVIRIRHALVWTRILRCNEDGNMMLISVTYVIFYHQSDCYESITELRMDI